MIDRLLVPQFEVTDVQFFGERHGPADELGLHVRRLCDDAVRVEVRQADEIAAEECAAYEREREETEGLPFSHGLHGVDFVILCGAKDVEPGGVLAEGNNGRGAA